jgi:hypothetical protein
MKKGRNLCIKAPRWGRWNSLYNSELLRESERVEKIPKKKFSQANAAHSS